MNLRRGRVSVFRLFIMSLHKRNPKPQGIISSGARYLVCCPGARDFARQLEMLLLQLLQPPFALERIYHRIQFAQ